MTPKGPNLRQDLERKTREELIVLAKTLRISNCRAMRKAELVSALLETADDRLARVLYPSWWGQYHNHVYGLASVMGVVLGIIFFVWPSNDSPVAETDRSRIVKSIETPIRFADFVALPPYERTALLDRYRGKPTVWEGFVSATSGFEPGSLHLPLEIPVSVRIASARGTFAQITADCQFGALEPTDSGIERAMKLHLLSIGQRVRISGALDGDCDNPFLGDAFLEAEWPMNE